MYKTIIWTLESILCKIIIKNTYGSWADIEPRADKH